MDKTQCSKKRVLVLDDDLAVLEVIEQSLVYENFDVRTEGRSYNLLKTIEDYRPDIILLDFLLDGINGGEFCHQVKSNASTKHIPVIIISGFPRVFLSLGSYGCDDFLAKPFSLSELMKSINNCLMLNTLCHG